MGEKPESEQVEEPQEEQAGESGDTVELSDIDELRQQLGEMQERMLRQQAEFDNTRKRLRREMEEAGNRALVRFIRPMLAELDNFDLALQAANPEKFEDFAMGVSMIKSNLDSHLNAVSIEVVPCEGVFNPSMHEVVQEMEDAEAPKGTILQVYRTGYQLGGQVIRAAQVVVAKGPVVQEAEVVAEDDAADSASEESVEE